MDLGTYKGILTGADSISSPADPEKLFEPGKWSESTLRKRLRNNRMPPGMPFLMDESNRDGPVVSAGKLAAVGTLPTTGGDGSWNAVLPPAARLAFIIMGSTLLLAGLALRKFAKSWRG
ncbi:MAG: hypothetical protein HY741_25150 [Chloroflexi bacterium]|nr:hypothetical protein [Chloroflexota bacterium]